MSKNIIKETKAIADLIVTEEFENEENAIKGENAININCEVKEFKIIKRNYKIKKGERSNGL
tara:strand:+ start:2408 stop:2593 length:186 start_codon:yes stop_codon:yes gene_type:complete